MASESAIEFPIPGFVELLMFSTGVRRGTIVLDVVVSDVLVLELEVDDVVVELVVEVVE